MNSIQPTRALCWWLFAAVLAAELVFMSGTVRSSDAGAMLQVTRSLAREGSFAVEPQTQGKVGRDGRTYAPYGPGCSVAALPLYLVGHATGRLLGVGPERQAALEELAVSLFNPLVVALTAVLVLLAALELGVSPGRAAGGGLLTAIGTGLFVQMKDFNSEPLSALALLAGAFCVLRYRRDPCALWPLLAGVALGVALLTRAANVLAAPVFGLYLLALDLRRVRGLTGAVLFSLPVLLGLAIYGWFNWVRFADPLETGYHTLSFGHPLLAGLYYQLFSLDRGLFWYNPLALLALIGVPLLWRRHRGPAALLAATSLVFLMLYSTYAQAPGGGQSAGQRFLLVVLPLLVLLGLPAAEAARRPGQRRLLAALLTLSVLVQLPLVWVNPSYYYARMIYEQDPTGEDRAPHTAAQTPLLKCWPLAVEVTRDALLRPEFILALPVHLPQFAGAAEKAVGARSYRVPYFWWSLAYFHGASPAAVLGALVAALALAVTAAWALGRAWPPPLEEESA